MPPSFDTLSLLALVATASVRASDVRMVHRAASDAVVTPTAPGPNDVFQIGGQCTMSWTPDTSGSSKWKDMTIDFMTGSNLAMVKLATVASNLDGTDPSTTSYSWTCPDVNPPSQIYFYQWTYGAEKDPQWTTRFLITAADGTSVSPPNATQPDGKAIGWGIGSIGATTGSGSSDSNTTSTPSNPDGTNGSSSGSSDTTSSDSALPSTTTAPSDATSATGLTNTSSPTSAASTTAPSSAGRASMPAFVLGGAAVVAAAVAQILL